MSQCKQSATEFIQDTFSPHIAVLCSNDAQMLCEKNNLTFVQLIQPFSRLSSEGKHTWPYLVNIQGLYVNVGQYYYMGYYRMSILLHVLLEGLPKVTAEL